MVSSTTNPMASTIPNRVKTLMEKSAMYMIKNVPINEIGIVSMGIIVVRQSLRKRKIIPTTKIKANNIVCCTSLIEAFIYWVLSKLTFAITSGETCGLPVDPNGHSGCLVCK